MSKMKTEDNPLGTINVPTDEGPYTQLWKRCQRDSDDKIFYDRLEEIWGVRPNFEFIDRVALHTAIYLDSYGNEPKYHITYQQGHLVYCLLRYYLRSQQHIEYFDIVEVGTARGFTALCMAKALEDEGKKGTIHTIDILPHDKPIYWRSIGDVTGKKTRKELLENWDDYLERYIKFYCGSSLDVLPTINVPRIHFTFLDGSHDYAHVKNELIYAWRKMTVGDVIVCDDVTEQKYPGIIRAVSEYEKETISFSCRLSGVEENKGMPRRGFSFLYKVIDPDLFKKSALPPITKEK